MADWCAIDLIEQDGRLRRVGAAHVEQGKEVLMREMDLHPQTVHGSKYGAQLMAGRPVLRRQLEQEELFTPDPERTRLLKVLGAESLITAPMVARGRVIGGVTFAYSGSGRRYEEGDLSLVQDLASRAAVAVENARLFREAQEANSAKDRFLALVSHELRNPLATLSLAVRALHAQRHTPEAMEHTLEVIDRSLALQSRLVEDLLDLSRVHRGTMNLKLEEIPFDEVVRSAVEDRREEVERGGIRLDLEVGEDVIIDGDFDRLEQVVANLLTNSVKYTPRDGAIRVSLSVKEGRAVLVVADTGSGIAPDVLPHVFEMFRQGEPPASQAGWHGLGIGLALVKSIVERHRGEVRAQSDGPGKGSRFTVELPLAKGAAGRG